MLSEDLVVNRGNGTPTLSAFHIGPELKQSIDDHLLLHLVASCKNIFSIHQDAALISMSKSSTLVRNTILATAASNLRHLSPSTKCYQVQENFHQIQVVRSLQEALNTPQDRLGQEGAKQLLLSMVLLNVSSFTVQDHEPEEPELSWVFSDDDNRLGWLALQAGTRPVLLSLTSYIDVVMEFLGPIFIGGDKTACGTQEIIPDISRIPESWARVFRLRKVQAPYSCDSVSSDPAELYRLAVIRLVRLQDIEFLPENVYVCILFLNNLSPPFRSLLARRDPRALWLLGYWMGLMRRFDRVWWLAKRVKRDHMAIVAYLDGLRLDQIPGEEGKSWGELMMELKLAPGMGRSDIWQ